MRGFITISKGFSKKKFIFSCKNNEKFIFCHFTEIFFNFFFQFTRAALIGSENS